MVGRGEETDWSEQKGKGEKPPTEAPGGSRDRGGRTGAGQGTGGFHREGCFDEVEAGMGRLERPLNRWTGNKENFSQRTKPPHQAQRELILD